MSLALTFALVAPASASTAIAAAPVAASRVSMSIEVFGFGDDGQPLTLPNAIPGDAVHLSGSVSPARPGRVVVQEYRAQAWREVVRTQSSSDGIWVVSFRAPAPGRHSYRAVVLRTAVASVGVSATTVLSVLPPSVAFAATRTVEAGRLLAVTGAAKPARPGVQVALVELRGPQWVPVATTRQSPKGLFTLRIRAASVGRHTYRVVTGTEYVPDSARSAPQVVTTVPASTPGVRSTSLADVNPRSIDRRPGYATGTYTIAGRQYPKSVHIASTRFTYELGAGASTFGAALSLVPVTRDRMRYRGPRLIDVSVDGQVRLRRLIKDGQALPLILDVRGAKVLSIASVDGGPLGTCCGSDVLLGTPVVTSEVRAERSADVGRVLSDLRPIALAGGLRTNQVEGSVSTTLYGGSLTLPGSINQNMGPGGVVRTGYADYALGGSFRRLTGVPGVTGEVTANVTGSIRIYGDGRRLATWPATVAARERAVVDVTGVQRLRIEVVADQPQGEQQYPWYVFLGDPRLE